MTAKLDPHECHQQGPTSSVDAPLPRPKRRSRRAKADRGLPPDEELANLAAAYLERQRKHWPKLAEAGLLPEPTDGVVRQMVEDFKARHRTGKVDLDAVRPCAKAAQRLGGDYNRYSCDKSSPTSIIDQMVNALDKARQEDRLVPWQYIFADYSVTGLDASRQGYSSYKAILSDEKHLIETTYIDDFSRASRDEIEWFKLAAMSKRLKKRMIGASDGFDLNDPNSDLLITMFGLVSRLFIKGLREKVKRGIRGAMRRGTYLGSLPLGYTRRVHRDENGNIAYRPDGRPKYEPCIDPETREHVLLIFELFTQKSWSKYKIARHFNKLKVDEWDGWTDRTIHNILSNSTYIGRFIWNRTTREYDWEQEKWVVVKNPRSEWAVYRDPNLALVPRDWWRAARRRLAAMRRESPLTGKKPSRNQISATTLFSGTLFCEYCGEELKLIRSTEKDKQMGCLNGVRYAHDCKLSTSKSTGVIEECLLTYIREVIFTESVIEDLVKKGNTYLEQEARKPQVDTAPMKAKARKLEAKIRKLVKMVEDEPDEELCGGYHKRIKELQKDLNRLQAQIREADQQNRRKDVKPLELDQAKTYLADLRGLLNQEIPVAAEAIRTLTGPIRIRHEPIPGRKRGAPWIATFSPDLLRLLRQVANDNDYPDSVALANAEWTEPQSVELQIEKIPKYEQLAPVFKEMHDKGASVEAIASAHGTTFYFTAQTIHFANTGERPKWIVRKRTGTGSKRTGTGSKRIKFREIAKEVSYLRDKKKMPFRRIAAKLVVSICTARRAYDYEHQEAIREAAERGETPYRGRYSHLGEDVYQKIRELLRAGKKPAEIASKAGCSKASVHRVRRRMHDEADKDKAV